MSRRPLWCMVLLCATKHALCAESGLTCRFNVLRLTVMVAVGLVLRATDRVATAAANLATAFRSIGAFGEATSWKHSEHSYARLLYDGRWHGDGTLPGASDNCVPPALLVIQIIYQ